MSSGEHIAHRKATAVGGQVHALLLVSVLDPPFAVSVAAEQEALELSGLGPIIMSTDLAGSSMTGSPGALWTAPAEG